MAQHGYLREYDEAPDRGEDRDWRERGDRGRRAWEERDRNFMFDDDGNRSRFRSEDDRNERGAWENNRDWPQRDRGMDRGYNRDRAGYMGSRERGDDRDRFSSHPDDHYRSWRDRQMQSLDRDYADYCREREQQFHRDFDSWRQNRQQSSGRRGTDAEVAVESELELTHERALAGEGNTPSPEATATLGTNNPENSATDRRQG